MPLRYQPVFRFTVMAVLCGAWQSIDAQSDGLTAAAALEQTRPQSIEQAEPSVVSIARWRTNPADLTEEGLPQRNQERLSNQQIHDILPNQFSAGILLVAPGQEERFVLTTYHSVRGGVTTGSKPAADSSHLQVRFSSRHYCPATIYAADPRSDLAVLKLETRDLGLRAEEMRPIPWPTTTAVRKGQFVLTLSNPYWIARDGSPSVSWGIVSNIARRPALLKPDAGGLKTLHELGSLIQVDYRLPIGASGAPVLNLRGELVGMCSSIAAIEGFDRSGGFAIPIDATTRWIIESLLNGQEVEYGFLGIEPNRVLIPANSSLTRQPSAAEAKAVQIGSPAQAAGIRQGDLVLAVNGQPTLNELDLMRQVTLHPPESQVKLTIYRPINGAELTLTAKLGKWPVRDDEGIVASQRRQPLWRGMGVDYPTARQRFVTSQLAIPAAVLVTEVREESPADQAGLQPGDFIVQVNRTPVRTPAEFAAAVKQATGNVTMRLLVPEGQTRATVVQE
ncbi:MAG: PDZ domain-containing protein [Planctomycetaceae bacterium]|nr:PDZ domain-containing protein [Planctomycetaceae bacterium]